MWDFPGPGLKPVSPALAGRCLTTAPPGKPLNTVLKNMMSKEWLNKYGSMHIYFINELMELMTGESMGQCPGIGKGETYKEKGTKTIAESCWPPSHCPGSTLPGWPKVPWPHYWLFLWLQLSHSTPWNLSPWLQNVTNNAHLINKIIVDWKKLHLWGIPWRSSG